MAAYAIKDGQELVGKVLERFPSQDRKDVTFPEGIEMFCQPGGWEISYYSKPSTFYVSVLTDMAGTRSYVACLSFYEPFTLVRKGDDFDNAINVSGDTTHTKLSCDNLYIMVEWDANLEKIIGSVLGFVHVPLLGSDAVTFSIGIGEKENS
ncbi:myotubularin-related protein 13-like [Dendronephthya gigantea]|uniref:myotubularin-related protein 13-like n=1 Tax=Dendronephthya gigantea TaxID=151771 RepID=UPI00106BC9A9|nr:myotubularin-related protein 13-like [Dendronephthya gigantea]